jgi:fatty acid omega-hydroxylase
MERKLRASVRDLNAFAQEVIDERRQKSVDEGTDLLSRCLSIGDDDGLPFSDKYLRDIIMNFMYAQTSPLCPVCWLKSTFAHSLLAM